MPTPITWSGPIGFEGQLTGDGRVIEKNALSWEELPLNFRHVASDVGAHDGAVVAGSILSIERKPKGVIWGHGEFDVETPEGYKAARQVFKGLTRGVSMDLDNVAFEVRVAEEMLAEPEDGDELQAHEVDKDGRVTVYEVNPDDEVMAMMSARVRAATLVAIPAFAGANITLDDPDAFEALSAPDASLGLTASASQLSPDAPPREWMQDPKFEEVTPLTILENGRVFGHLAAWETVHIAHEFQYAPHSLTNYAYFRTGAILCDDGSQVAIGRLTMNTLHAGDKANANAAVAHYEHTGTAAAYLAAGEDDFGIWVAGTIRPGLSASDIRSLRASPISGDWRRIGGNLELVAALAVNVPGFPIPRPKGLVASGHIQSLVASGMVAPRVNSKNSLSGDDLKYLKRLAARERKQEQKEITDGVNDLATRVNALRAKQLAKRVKSLT